MAAAEENVSLVITHDHQLVVEACVEVEPAIPEETTVDGSSNIKQGKDCKL